MDGTVIVRVKRNCFDGQTGYDAERQFPDGTKCQTIARVPEEWAQRELTELKEKAPIEKATEDDLAAFEACVEAGTAKPSGKKK
jgi:hypothetical protein